MNNQSPFYIYISNSPVSNAGSSSSGKSEWSSVKSATQSAKYNTNSDGGKSKFLSKYIGTRLAESGIHIAERGITASINYIGYGMGDYSQSKNSQFVWSYAQRIANVGVGAGVALITGHPLVAGIDVVVGIASIAESTIIDTIEQQSKTKQSNYNAEQIERRAGLSSTRDGSRGTEN